ncbi:MAG: AAA family ATPase [Bacillota bacterium]|nr:AAA family ATPase [Bacillota bacterium]
MRKERMAEEMTLREDKQRKPQMEQMREREQQWLDRTVAWIDRLLEELRAGIRQRLESDRDLITRIHDDGLLGRDNALAELANLNQELDSNQSLYSHAVVEERRLLRVRPSPYFGRFRFRYDDGGDSEDIVIGLLSLMDLDNGVEYVIDWRSPIASVYYDYETGPAAYEAPGGRISGQVESRWQIVIRDARVRLLFETGQEVHDEILQDVLSHPVSERMRAIVATMQREQNRLVRVSPQRSLLVQGVAGSGKTAIALHRAAYLLYRQPGMTAADILMLTPNEELADYIAQVLPDLGEEPLDSLTWTGLLQAELATREGHFADMAIARAPRAKRELASSFAFLTSLGEYAAVLPERACRLRDLGGRGWQLARADLERFFYDNYAALPPLLRNRAMLDNVLDLLRAQGAAIRRVRPEVERELAAINQISRLSELLLDFTRWYAAEHPGEAYPLSGDAIYRDLAVAEIGPDADPGADTDPDPDPRPERHAPVPGVLEGRLRAALLQPDGSVRVDLATESERLQGYDEVDLAVLCWLKLAAYGPGYERTVSHLIIDEMQDLPLVAHDCLARLFPVPRTILGDINQALAHSPDADWLRQLAAIHAQTGPVDCTELLRSYRSTYEITRFGTAILSLEGVEAIRRHGEPVRIFYAKSPTDRRLAADRLVRRAQAAGRRVARLVVGRDAGTAERIATREGGLPLESSKGLEYDEVVLTHLPVSVPGDAAETRRRLRRLYVGATRALHRLSIVCSEKQLALLPAQLTDDGERLYELVDLADLADLPAAVEET